MQAVIFCAGKSTRTYPLTLSRPKPLLKIANKTLLEYNLAQLKGLVDEVIIVIGYKRDVIREFIGDSYENLKIKYVIQEKQDGTGSALAACKDVLKDKFVVLLGDDMYSRKDIKKCLSHEYCILTKYVPDLSRFGEIIYDESGVKLIKEKPEPKEGLANTGLMALDKKVFEFNLEKSKRGEYEITDYIKKLIEAGKKVKYEKADLWVPITYAWNLLEGNEYLLSKIEHEIKGSVEKGAVLKGKISVGKNTIVKAGSYIEGPVIIGENCKIGPNCYIRQNTSIGNNCNIGNAVEIKNSIIGDNCCIAHLAYVGDSVIGENVNLGAGTKIANLRHDNANVKSMIKGVLIDSGRRKLGSIIGDNVHTGINTSIYPGRKIWPNKTTLPGEIVNRDIE
jgi:UDP-N-acetylglucosamine diphosphorylase / glucose-1-phosphate thymidylyltransferase / UDP-N-acetylgalactosamine diphosphorylase / glucosamine-1-phosphate N-acetyltransferase / galactosamine-1-phosphate N-acetyltransferase